MAGKHVTTDALTTVNVATLKAAVPNLPPTYPGLKGDRSYAEGRQAFAAGEPNTANPHVFGLPEWYSWQLGWGSVDGAVSSGMQYQTAIADTNESV